MSLNCRNDLVLSERRRPLSSKEELALRTHLESCESCRIAREIGAAFDEQGELAFDDGARIARLAARARAPRRSTARRASRIALLAACLSLLAGAAIAAVGWIQRPAETSASASASAASSNAVHAAGPAPLALAARGGQPTLAPASDVATPPSSAAPAKTPVLTPSSPSSSAQLFRKANDLRRAGQAQQAIQLYRSLQRDYPGSAEAALSPVSLGGLLLNRASAGAALEQFDHYLAASPGAALAAEALYGRARALQALGRHSEEKRTWEQLLARFPGCPYRESARRRLTELR
jgi:TolA-binding protein